MELCVGSSLLIHTQVDILHKKGRLRPFSFRKFTHNSIFCSKLGLILTRANLLLHNAGQQDGLRWINRIRRITGVLKAEWSGNHTPKALRFSFFAVPGRGKSAGRRFALPALFLLQAVGSDWNPESWPCFSNRRSDFPADFSGHSV